MPLLFMAAGASLVATAAMAFVAFVPSDRPEPCCAASAPVSVPTRAGPADTGLAREDTAGSVASRQRSAALPTCLVGSWQSAQETVEIEFFAEAAPVPFETAGRVVTYRPDGTGTERGSVTYHTRYQGQELKIVASGSRDFTWSATKKELTLHVVTRSDITYTFWVDDIEIDTVPDETGAVEQTNTYACADDELTENSVDTGYTARWTRVGDLGGYP